MVSNGFQWHYLWFTQKTGEFFFVPMAETVTKNPQAKHSTTLERRCGSLKLTPAE